VLPHVNRILKCLQTNGNVIPSPSPPPHTRRPLLWVHPRLFPHRPRQNPKPKSQIPNPKSENPKPKTPNPKPPTVEPSTPNPTNHPRRHPTLRRLTLAPTSLHCPRSPVTLPPRSKSRRYIHLQSSNPSNHNITPLTHIINRWAAIPPTRNSFPRLPQRPLPLPPPGRGRVPCAA